MMNTIMFKLVFVPKTSQFMLPGRNFSEEYYIKVSIDGVDLHSTKEFEDSLLYYEELERSLSGTGKYLIFTAANGVADTGGWELIQVTHLQGRVLWDFSREVGPLHYEFDAALYKSQVQALQHEIISSQCSEILQPKYVIFPE